MVYKKYIKRGSKLYGPYYCESYRDKNREVRTRFISGPKDKDRLIRNFKEKASNFFGSKRVLFISKVIIGIFLLLIIGNINYSLKTTGKVIQEQDSS